MKQRCGIRRIVIQASIFLLLGAIVNVAVAWGYGLLGKFLSTNNTLSLTFSKQGECAVLSSLEESGTAVVVVVSTAGMPGQFHVQGPREARDAIPEWVADPEATRVAEHAQRVYFAAGWPTLALWCAQVGDFSSGNVATRGGWPLGRLLVGSPGWPAVLPALPLWPGFAINTLFYAGILWLFALPGALRRRRRIKHGLCPACAYPVGASNLCTECGRPVKAGSSVRASA